MTLVRAVPAQLRLTLEARVRKDVPVVLRYGEAPAGYRVRQVELSPQRIQVTGPESRVQTVNEVQTDPLDLDGLRTSAGTVHEVMLNTFIADPHVSPVASTVIRARVLLEKID